MLAVFTRVMSTDLLHVFTAARWKNINIKDTVLTGNRPANRKLDVEIQQIYGCQDNTYTPLRIISEMTSKQRRNTRKILYSFYKLPDVINYFNLTNNNNLNNVGIILNNFVTTSSSFGKPNSWYFLPVDQHRLRPYATTAEIHFRNVVIFCFLVSLFGRYQDLRY